MNPAGQVLEELRQPARDLSERIPGVPGGYGALSTTALTDGALDAKANQLAAWAIAKAEQGTAASPAHGHGAAGHDATGVEVAEALGVAIMMNGRPGRVRA